MNSFTFVWYLPMHANVSPYLSRFQLIINFNHPNHLIIIHSTNNTCRCELDKGRVLEKEGSKTWREGRGGWYRHTFSGTNYPASKISFIQHHQNARELRAIFEVWRRGFSISLWFSLFLYHFSLILLVLFLDVGGVWMICNFSMSS